MAIVLSCATFVDVNVASREPNLLVTRNDIQTLVYNDLLTLKTAVDAINAGTVTLTDIQLSSGTVSAPAATWASDTTSGRYLIAAGNEGVAISGAKVLDISATGLGVTGAISATSASATSFTVGRLGATTPAFTVDSSTSSQVAGLSVTGAATGGTVAIVTTDSGSATNLTINAKGTGTIGIGSVSTGAVTITPATTITGALTLTSALKSTTQVLTGSGAVNLTTLVTKINTTGGGTYTLADGTDGQVKIVVMDVDAGDGTITPTTKTGYSTIVLNDAGDGCGLVFVTTRGWIVFSNFGCTIS